MSAHRLKLMRIQGYKSIKDQEINLSAINILIGQNGAGKSNFISIFKFLRNVIEQRLKNYSLKTGAENLLYYGSKETKSINVYLDFSPNFYNIKLEPTSSESLIVASEYCGFRKGGFDRPYWELVTNSEEESRLEQFAKTYKIGEYVYVILKSWRVYHFHDTSESAPVKKYGSVANNKFLFEDASNLAAFLYVLKQREEEYYDHIVKTVQLVIPFFKDFVLQPNPLNEENIRLEWNDKYSDRIFTANELSDGSLRFICMAVLLLQRWLPKVILLDEPELGLHPSAITVLAGLLKKASKRSQVIVATQSTNLVDEFDPEDIIVVENKNAETTFKNLDPGKLETWLNEYSLGELWDKNIIGGRP